MLRQAVAHGVPVDSLAESFDPVGRRRRRFAQQLREHPGAALERCRPERTSEQRHHARYGQQASSGQAGQVEGPRTFERNGGDAVQLQDCVVDRGGVGGEQLAEVAIVVDERGEEPVEFGPHRVAKGVVEAREATMVLEDVEGAEVKPLPCEALYQGGGAQVVEHTLHLRLDRCGVVQDALCHSIEQSVVGHAAQQEVRQARGHLVLGIDFHLVQERGGQQHRLQNACASLLVPEAFGEQRGVQRLQPRSLVGAKRPTPGSRHDVDEQHFETGLGRVVARQRTCDGFRCERLGRGFVTQDVVRRRRLQALDIVEP